MITGPSGSGKSDLAIRLIDRGATLVSDDQVIIERDNEILTLVTPANIAGKIELYSLGVFACPFISNIALSLLVELSDNTDRYPLSSPTQQILGVTVPIITLDGQRSSAPIKIEMALQRTMNMEPQQ
ncbi:MAG: hypothetical protein Pars2KO_22530 [Parasphingorhabdus sp.]